MTIDIMKLTKTAIVEKEGTKPEIEILKMYNLKDGGLGYYPVATLRFDSIAELDRFANEIALHTMELKGRVAT